jgi:hypothetical protein
VYSFQYAEKEKENILLFEAKKKYYLQVHKIARKNMSEDDSLAIDKMSVKDSMFVHYLNNFAGDSMMFTLQDKCDYIIGRDAVAKGFDQLRSEREAVFKSYFGENAKQIKFKRDAAIVPFNGFSYYKIEYNGEIPKSLLKAYQEMDQLNEEAPRKKYRKERGLAPESKK